MLLLVLVRVVVVELAGLFGEGLSRAPLGRVTWRYGLEHGIYLLEGESLGLWHQKVRIYKGASAESSPNEEDGRAKVTLVLTDHVRSDDGDDGVPEPVGGGRESDTTGTDREREDFTDENPGTRSPGRGEEEDEDGNEGDLSVNSSDVVGNSVSSSINGSLVESDGNTDDGNEELTDEHTESTVDEERATTETFNGVERDGSRADVNDGEDHRDEERRRDGTGRLEERSRVVEDEVDTGPLLHHLKGSTEDSATKVGGSVEDRSREAGSPGGEPGTGRNSGSLDFSVGDNFGEFDLDEFRVSGLTTETDKGVASLLELALLDEVTRRVGKEEETGSEDDSPCELDTDRNAVSSSVRSVLGEVADDRGKHDTDGNAELVTGNESTTDLARADLGHVEDDNGRNESDTETSEETTDDDSGQGGSSEHLNDDTSEVDTATSDDSRTTTHHIGEITSNEGTEEGTGGKDRDDEGGVRRRDGGSIGTGDGSNEFRGGEDTVDVTRVVTEEDTTEGGEGAHHVGLEGDGGLNSVDIVGLLEFGETSVEDLRRSGGSSTHFCLRR